MPATTKKNNFSFLSQIHITSTPTPSSSPSPIIPLKGTLAVGTYDSELVSFDEVIENGMLTAVDFVHKLDGNGEKNLLVKFRLYYPREINKLLEILSQYGYNGKFTDIVGLKETVTLNESSKSSYIRITDRQLQALPAPKPTGGLLSTKRAVSSKKPAPAFLDDEEDEDDDFLDDEEI